MQCLPIHKSLESRVEKEKSCCLYEYDVKDLATLNKRVGNPSRVAQHCTRPTCVWNRMETNASNNRMTFVILSEFIWKISWCFSGFPLFFFFAGKKEKNDFSILKNSLTTRIKSLLKFFWFQIFIADKISRKKLRNRSKKKLKWPCM